MNFKDSLKDYIRAAFSGVWVQTYEPDEAQREIGQLCREAGWLYTNWDLDSGDPVNGAAVGDPLAALDLIHERPEQTIILTLRHYHCFLKNPLAAEKLFNKVLNGKQDRLFYVVLSPVVQIPVELEKLFVVIEHELPDARAVETILDDLGGAEGLDGDLGRSIAAAAGLTRYEAEGAFALSLARHDAIKPAVVWELKQSMLKKSGLLELHRGKETFAQLGGLDALKSFCSNRPWQASGGLHARRVPQRRDAPRRARRRKKRLRQGARQRVRKAHPHHGRGRLLRLLGRPDRRTHPPGPQDRRRDGPLRALH